MAAPTIHVHTQADKSTVPYAKFMWETMMSMANQPGLLKLTVHCMGPTAAARAEGWIGNCRSIVTPNRKSSDPLNGSRGRGVCVMEALGMTGDGDIHVISDSDTVVVAKGWDDYLRKRLINDGIHIMGSTYEELGGFSSGASTVQTYKKVPSLTWCALSPLHDWRDLDVMPNKSHQVAISTPALAEIYNLPVGYSVFGEVGWQIPKYVSDHHLNYDGWKQLKPTKDAAILKGLSDYHEEFHAGDIPFIAHHRGSMRHAYRGDRISRQFYAAVDSYLATEGAQPSRFKWLEAECSVQIPVFGEQKPFTVETPVDPIAVTPEVYTPRGREWMKVTFNGTVIRPKSNVDRTKPATQLEIERPAVDKLGHIRVEGSLEYNFPLVLPPVTVEPYMVTVRNATGAPLMVNSGAGGNLALPAGKTWFLLVDVDGVQRVE